MTVKDLIIDYTKETGMPTRIISGQSDIVYHDEYVKWLENRLLNRYEQEPDCKLIIDEPEEYTPPEQQCTGCMGPCGCCNDEMKGKPCFRCDTLFGKKINGRL